MIFSKNKLILLILFKNKVLVPEYHIIQLMIKEKIEFYFFFFTEIKNYIGLKLKKSIIDRMISYDKSIFCNFEEWRGKCVNESLLCKTIREDLIKEFCIYINQANLSFDSKIRFSILKTNPLFESNHKITLIEYAAFYGSIKIFKFLSLKAQLEPLIWIYAIHSNSQKMIHILKEMGVKPPNHTYEKCLEEAIKCHHNELALYFLNNYFDDQYTYYFYKYFNFELILENDANNVCEQLSC